VLEDEDDGSRRFRLLDAIAFSNEISSEWREVLLLLATEAIKDSRKRIR
jgi:hypothetical protein